MSGNIPRQMRGAGNFYDASVGEGFVRADMREQSRERGERLLAAYDEVSRESGTQDVALLELERAARAADDVVLPDSLEELELAAQALGELELDGVESRTEKTERSLAEEIYDKLGDREIEQEVKRWAGRITSYDLYKLFGGKEFLDNENAQKRMDKKIVSYMSEVLELDEVPPMDYIDDPDSTVRAKLSFDRETSTRKVVINRAHVHGDDVKESFCVISHEMMHAHQRGRAQSWQPSRVRSKMSEQDWQMARLYKLNFAPGNYIKPRTDRIGYRNQLVEVEARMFAAECSEKYDRYLEKYGGRSRSVGQKILGMFRDNGGRNRGRLREA